MQIPDPTQFEVIIKLPIFGFQLAPLAPELVQARQALQELRITHPEPLQSNVKGEYTSPWKSHLLNAKLQPLCQLVINLTEHAAKHHWNTDIRKLNFRLEVLDCWGSIYGNKGHTTPHTHFPADFSCVVYLDTEEGCAPLIFENQIKLNPMAGMIVIFPGVLLHQVPENQGQRTVVALNMFKVADFS
ncbi:MAG: hypothetical protein KGR21_03945 [Proteobacteria bacterium]|nr:hypothetical protein [Pseudomonadota bacterium]NBP36625.1 hypothetical protein [Betaproteobacteria bacterium]NBP40764.1 hypothetical protein [Betaproteobacteria bacterium]NBQ80150.1 hypothetical protein [Betaproteobacteria bacterium]NBS40748.1 hypothetical protein [Betaproteobacteria bacterium]